MCYNLLAMAPEAYESDNARVAGDIPACFADVHEQLGWEEAEGELK